VQVFSGSKATSTATVCITKDDNEIHDAAIGDGPVDAIFKSISRLIREKIQVTLGERERREIRARDKRD
jgi:LeuA allosteric (dimerisation) domain